MAEFEVLRAGPALESLTDNTSLKTLNSALSEVA